jgi:Alpha/beta hydrolase family
MNIRLIKLPILAALAFTACAPSQNGLLNREAGSLLKQASAKSLSPEQRAVLYLDSARDASRLLDSRDSGPEAARIYNQAAADLTALLRAADQGRLWNRPLVLTSGTTTYRLKFAKASGDGIWDPAYFTGMTPADQIPDGDLDRRNLQAGIGGTLVGNHQPATLPPHVRPAGINAAVTATLDFKSNEVLLTLIDPSVRKSANVCGAARTLAADYSAPLAAYPQGSELWNGLMAALRVDQHMKDTGLFMVSPYDPERIPVIFVHGLASTPRMWRRVINELETDPEFRRRYQCWLFSYPTGNPPAYSAMRLRQDLASIERAYPRSRPYVLIGHSMGGLLSRMQVATVKRENWNQVMGPDKTARFFAKVKPGDIVDQSTRFEANRHIDRVIFICTPHRGSEMAVGSIGELATKLIALPVSLTSAFAQSVGDSISIITGDSKHMPNSVTGLSPGNPTLKMLDTVPITAPHHSIIGDRGKGDTPNSSDGVVKYWSSHLKSAQSELIVPGPHGACEMPETLSEIRRILHRYCGKPAASR